MPVKVIIKGKVEGGVKDVVAHYKKKLGDATAGFGGVYKAIERVPTGLFPFDLAVGGGFPRGRCSIVWGAESSAKTSMALRAIAMHQKIWPDQVCGFIAIEPFDGLWAQKLGVDLLRLAVFNPAYAEEAVDMAGHFLEADDAGLLVIDSLAAMITTTEDSASAEKQQMGGASVVTGKLVRKTTKALREAEKQGRQPTLLYINQTRFKIGVMFGDPTTMPGGNAPKFQAHLNVRLHGVAIKDAKVSDTYPVRREIHFSVKKFKLPIVADNGKVEMVTFPHDGLQVGECDDMDTIKAYLESFQMWEKLGKTGWSILGVHYPTQQVFKDKVYADRKFGADVRAAIVKRVLDESGGLMQPPPGGVAAEKDAVVEEEEV